MLSVSDAQRKAAQVPDKPEEPTAPEPTPLIPEDLSTLSDKDLGELEAKLRKDYGTHRAAAQAILDGKAKGGSVAEAAAAARAAVEALQKIREDSARRETERQQAASELLEMDSVVNPPEPEEAPAPETPEEAPPETTADPATPEVNVPAVPAEKPAPPKPKAIAASATPRPKPPTAAAMKGQPVDPDRLPDTQHHPTVTITAAGDVPRFSSGQTLTAHQLGEATTEKIISLLGPKLDRRPSPGRYYIASLEAQMPKERALLASASALDNHRVIEKAMGAEALQPILAAGGVCAPAQVDYSLITLARRGRPVKDSLTTFPAERGSLRFMRNARLSNVAAGVGIWTQANDANPTSPTTKPCVTVTCPTDFEIEVDAITTCVQVGNFDRKFFPEHFQQWWDLALVQHDLTAEIKILDAFKTYAQDDANGGWSVYDPGNLGAALDLVATYDRMATAMRSRQAVPQDTPVQAWLPETVPGIIRTDILREHPGDGLVRFAITMEQLMGWFSARNIRVTWYRGTETGAGQTFGFQGGGDPELAQPWPASAGGGSYTSVIGYMTFPGLVGLADAGRLDFGMEIRDSVLNKTNDVMSMFETFEAPFWRGIEFGRIQSRLCIDGSTSAAIDFGGCAGS